MSEFTHSRQHRLELLLELSNELLQRGHAREFLGLHPRFIGQVVPSDFILLFDSLLAKGMKARDLISVSNKIFNIFYETLISFERLLPPPGSLLWTMEKNNREMNAVLQEIKPLFRKFQSSGNDPDLRKQLRLSLKKLQQFTQLYTIKENILFPVIEKRWIEFRCVQLMWAFHDEIRQFLREAIEALEAESINYQCFNRLMGDIFFYMKTIQFRDEHILFPEILATIEPEIMEQMLKDALALGFPYFTPDITPNFSAQPTTQIEWINLGTGSLSWEQVRLIFNHLPVDITYVDENDEVKYFSAPRKRVFPRTHAIIGRKVVNCHPPDSVYIVEKILESFKKGEKDQATFWIHFKGEFVLIQYFAVRDELGKYRGVVEVTQEITEIRALEGEKRLLDW